MRVVIDTCVWVAALRSRRGASFALLSEVSHGRFQFGVSVPLFLEYQAKLRQAAAERVTPLHSRQIEAILAALAHYGESVPIFYRLRPNLRDAADDLVFECAANYGARYIVTHNIRDFVEPELRGYAIEPVTPGRFIQILRAEE